MNLDRARQLMEEQNLDGLLVVGPENVSYATRTPIGPVHMWRRFGPYLAIIPKDPTLPTAAIVVDTHETAVRDAGVIDEVRTHPAWIEYADVSGIDGDDVRERVRSATSHRELFRPERYDLGNVLPALKETLADRNLRSCQIGVDLDYLPVTDQAALFDVLREFDLKASDCSELIQELRLIKSDWEIDRLRTALQLTEQGIRAAVNSVQAGKPRSSVSLALKRGFVDAAAAHGQCNLTGTWDITSVGPRTWSVPESPLIEAGDLIKFDCGAIVDGYIADMGRTFVVGFASRDQRLVHDALRSGMHAMLEAITPGIPFHELFCAAERSIRASGFESYTRGHFGHSIGSDVGQEEWPWISRTESRLIEPHMVLALETPYYIDGVGGFMLEHNVVVHDDHVEVLNELSDDLEEIPG